MELFLHPTRRFKTALIRVYLLQPLGAQQAAALALAGSVLKQGSAELPSRQALYGALDGLYGADLDLDAGRIGEVQLLGRIRVLCGSPGRAVAPRNGRRWRS